MFPASDALIPNIPSSCSSLSPTVFLAPSIFLPLSYHLFCCWAWIVLLHKRDSPNHPYMSIYYSPRAALFLSQYSNVRWPLSSYVGVKKKGFSRSARVQKGEGGSSRLLLWLKNKLGGGKKGEKRDMKKGKVQYIVIKKTDDCRERN